MANGNWFNGNAQPLSLGINTITVASVSFDRSVKIQFSSGDVAFNSIVHNGNDLDLNEGLCPATSTQTVTIGTEDNSTFSYSATEYCSNDTDPSPTIAGTSGGKFTSTIGLVIDSLTGAIDLDSSSSGTYVVTYTTPLPEQTISSLSLIHI